MAKRARVCAIRSSQTGIKNFMRAGTKAAAYIASKIPDRLYPGASSSNEAGAKARIDTSKLSFLIGMVRPRGRPRKSTCWAVLAAVADGSFTTIFPDLPATSHMRSRVPLKAGDDPKAVTSTPGRETFTPVPTAGNLPPGPVAVAASKGTLASKAGTARSFPSQTRTRELHVPEYQ